MRFILGLCLVWASSALWAINGLDDNITATFGSAVLTITPAGEVKLSLDQRPVIKKDHVSAMLKDKFLYSSEWTREAPEIDIEETNESFRTTLTLKKAGAIEYRKIVNFKDGELTLECNIAPLADPPGVKSAYTLLLDRDFDGSVFSTNKGNGTLSVSPQSVQWSAAENINRITFPKQKLTLSFVPNSWNMHDLRAHSAENVQGLQFVPNAAGKYQIKLQWKNPQVSVNLFPGDTSFETGVGFWMPQGKCELDGGTAKFGQKSLKLSAPFGFSYVNGILGSGGIKLNADDYVFSVWLKGESDNQPLTLRAMRGDWGHTVKEIKLDREWRQYDLALPKSLFRDAAEEWYFSFDSTARRPFWLDGVLLQTGDLAGDYAEPQLMISLNSPAPGNIFVPGDAAFFRLGVDSPTARKLRVDAVTYALFPEREVSSFHRELALTPNAAADVALDAAPAEPGYYRLTLRCDDPQVPVRDVYFVVAPPATASPDCFAGMRAEASIPELEALRRIGCKWVSLATRADWSEIEPEPGKFDQSLLAFADDAVNLARDSKMEVRLGLGATPRWASSAPADSQIYTNYPPKDFAALTAYGKFIGDHFRGRVACWEILGEADLSWRGSQNWSDQVAAKNIADVIKAAGSGLRVADPATKVSGCGVSSASALPFMEQILRDCPKALDSVDIHPYAPIRNIGPAGKWIEPENNFLYENLLQARKIIDQVNPAIDFGVGELGYTLDKSVAYDSLYAGTHAAILQRSMLLARAAGASRINWYCSFNNDEPYGYRYGVWRAGEGYQPLPAAASFALGARLTDSAKLRSKDLLANAIMELAFERGKEMSISLWNALNDKTIEMEFTAPVDGVTVVDMFGFPLARPRSGEKVICKISRYPLHFLIAADQLETVRAALRAADFRVPPLDISISPADAGHLKLEFANRISMPVGGKVKVELTGGILPQSEWTLPKVPINGKSELLIPFKGDGTIEVKAVVTTNRNAKVEVRRTLDLFPLQELPAGATFELNAPVKLSKEALRPPDIMNAKLWKGDDDFSVRFQGAWDKKYLYLGFDVADDVHRPAENATLAYLGDCVQFASDRRTDCDPGDGYSANNAEYGFALINNLAQSACYQAPDPVGKEEILTQISRQNNQTVYRISIPWSRLGMEPPAAGKVFKGSFVVFDQDGPNESTRWIELSGGIAGGKKPYLFKHFVLKGKP